MYFCYSIWTRSRNVLLSSHVFRDPTKGEGVPGSEGSTYRWRIRGNLTGSCILATWTIESSYTSYTRIR